MLGEGPGATGMPRLSVTIGAPLRCSTCSGRGNKTCATCKGEKKLLHFIQLVIAWYVRLSVPWPGGVVAGVGHGLQRCLQRRSTWLGLSQRRRLLGERVLSSHVRKARTHSGFSPSGTLLDQHLTGFPPYR